MNRTSLQIRMLYDKMGKAEKRIAQWILQNPGGLLPLSITELAEQCGCGEATIVRFARRLGFSGYQDLKISLAQEEGKTELNTEIQKTDSCMDILKKVSEDIYCALEMTQSAISSEALEQAVAALLSAKRIAVYGLGNSASIAQDLQHKFLRAGFDISVYSDNHMQAISAAHLQKGDAAIGISHSGSSKDIVDALRIAQEAGAVTIAITNQGKSPILKHSDIVLCTASSETSYSILGLNSRIAQLAIVNTLYYCAVCRRDAEARLAIEQTERALLNKKF